MQIRTARLSDVAGIQLLYQQLRPQDPVLSAAQAADRLAAVLAASGVRIFVVEQAGELVATCMLATIANFASAGRPIGVIEHVVTLQAHRGKGFAKALLQAVLAAAWSQGCYKVLLLSGADRPAAHRLYQSVGFDGDCERGFVVKAPLG